MIELKYRPDVDGLRAIAVALVLLFHADLGVQGGFVGVDVFFVISGFLITGLFLKEQRSKGFRLSDFWIRRLRRILPASTFVVTATLIAGLFALLPSDYAQMARSAVAQQLMLANVYFMNNTGYFEGASEEMPLLHTWSLAVEEQFYLGYPFLLMFLRRRSSKIAIASLIALMASSFAISEWAVHVDASAAFYLLPTRAWELLLGALLCFTPPPSKLSAGITNTLSVIGIEGILFAAWDFSSTTRFPGVAALLPCVSTVLIIYANSARLTWVGKVLATKPVVFCGLLSYSLYLWHWPLLSLLRHLNCGATPSTSRRIIALVAAFVLSLLSYRYIELPVRKKKVFAETKNLLLAAFGVVSLLLACSLCVIYSDGMPTRLDPRAIAFASAKDSKGFIHEMSASHVLDGEVPHFGVADGRHRCLVWGDSHAMALVPGIDAACKTHRMQGFQATHSATAPVLDFYLTYNWGLNERAPTFARAVVDFAKARQVDVVILAAVWTSYDKSPRFEESLSKTVHEFVDAGINVAIVRDVAVQKGDVPKMLSVAVRLGGDLGKIGTSLDEHLARNRLGNGIIDRMSGHGVSVLDPVSFFVDDSNIWRAELEGVSMYRDRHHLSIEGSLRLKPLFERLFDHLGLE
jgi:peptidoglycan/LPS O-acetylase OafA/YrhL